MECEMCKERAKSIYQDPQQQRMKVFPLGLLTDEASITTCITPLRPLRIAKDLSNPYIVLNYLELGVVRELRNVTYLAINICREEDDLLDVMVECTRKVAVEKMFRDRDIPFNVSSTEYGPMLSKTKPISKIDPFFSFSKPSRKRYAIDWKDFYPLNKIYDFMYELEKNFPSICSVTNIGRTVEGRDIKILRISNSNVYNTGIWLDAAIHAREWISTSAVTFIAEYVAKNFYNLPEHMTNKDWYILPVVNPDGYIHSHNVDRMWRKNRARVNNTIYGVDLNRNFSVGWSGSPENSSFDPSHLNYRGLEPFSEPEVAAIKDFILYSTTPFKIFLTFHSYSEVIAFPWCHTNDPCADYVSLLEGGTAMAKAIFNTTGRMYKVGGFKDLMYYAGGTSIDWSYNTARIPFTYLFELRSKEHKFLLPKCEIEECCSEVLNAVKVLTEFVETKKCLNCNIHHARQAKVLRK